MSLSIKERVVTTKLIELKKQLQLESEGFVSNADVIRHLLKENKHKVYKLSQVNK